jgi:predicted nucleic acid-binding Zn ribbon protein
MSGSKFNKDYRPPNSGSRAGGSRGGAPASVQGILAKALARNGLDEKVQRYAFAQHWKEIVGEVIAARSRPECLRRKSLVIRVQSSVWAQELSFLKEVIIRRMQPFLGEGQTVEDLQFYVAEL